MKYIIIKCLKILILIFSKIENYFTKLNNKLILSTKEHKEFVKNNKYLVDYKTKLNYKDFKDIEEKGVIIPNKMVEKIKSLEKK